MAVAVVAALRWFGGDSPEEHVTRARALARHGGPTDLRNADRELVAAIAGGPDRACIHAAQDLLRAHLWVEYGLLPDVAIIEESEDDRARCRDARVTDGLLAFANGDLDGAREAARAAAEIGGDLSLMPAHPAWLKAKVALTEADLKVAPGESAQVEARGGEALGEALAALEGAQATDPENAAYRRLAAELRVRRGDLSGALEELAAGRALSRTHLGLAADEALFLASARRELSSVADLSDQLLEIDAASMGPYDRGRAALARAVVHVHSGEVEQGMRRADEAWTLLAPWDRLARLRALGLALEAGDSERARQWLGDAELDPTTAAVFAAWARLVDGEVMAALAELAALPQRHPRVAYLQGLALVEQRRLDEAGPWIERARRFYPGWVELEVASARVAVETGDRVAALRRLQGLAEEESFAPRAWTGLGEAYLAQGDAASLPKAHQALKRAVEREPRPAEAMLRLAEVWQRWRRTDPEGERRALEWLERAVEAAPEVARYRLALARYLVDIGEFRRAEGLLRELVDAPGVDAQPALVLAHLALEQARVRDALPDGFDDWLAAARALGADEDALLRLEARAALVGRRWNELSRLRKELAAKVEALPDDVELRVLYARTLMAQRDDEEALKIVRRGIYSEEDGDGRLFLALAELEARDAKRKQGALHARAAWNRLKESERPTVELLAAADLGASLFVRTESDAAARALVRDLTRHLPLHGDAWRIRAQTELALGDGSDAKRSIEKAAALAPHNPRIHAMRGQILLRFGAGKRAAPAFERALELGGDLPEAERWRKLLRKTRR
ncbi:MAG: tetratricopeptide repeat protein [Nannocystaceae bacterium]